MSHNAEMILDQIDVVKLDITLWTSSKKLRKEDLVLANGSKLPPEDLAHLGTKKTIDPAKLKGFHRIKKEAERICLEKGTRFLGGFANPRAEIPRITRELDELAKAFVKERHDFLSDYEAETKAWVNRHPEFSDAIRRAIEPVGSVATKLRFDYVVFRVSKPLQPDDGKNLFASDEVGSLERRTASLSDQLFHEIAQDANELVNRSFIGKDTVTGRALNAFNRMRNKLNSLGFLDHRCMPVVDQIDAVLVSLPKAGPYTGSAFHDLMRLGLLLSDPNNIKRHGGGLLQTHNGHATFDEAETNDCIVDDNGIGIDGTQTSQEIVVDAVTNSSGVIPKTGSDDLPGFEDFLSRYDDGNDKGGETGMDNSPVAKMMTGLDELFESLKTVDATAGLENPVGDSGVGIEDEEPKNLKEKEVDFWF